MHELAVAARDEDHCVAHLPGVLISSWAGNVKLEHVQALERCIPTLLHRSPGNRYAAISVIEPSITMRLEDDARELSSALQQRWVDQTTRHAYLVEGTGFLPATVRTLTSGMHLMNRTPYPLKVFKDPLVLASWICEAADHLSADQIASAIARVRVGPTR